MSLLFTLEGSMNRLHLCSGLVEFLEVGNHRKHDSEIATMSRAQDGAQMCVQEIAALKAEPDGANSKKRIGFTWQAQRGHWLVSADIEGSDHGWSLAHR